MRNTPVSRWRRQSLSKVGPTLRAGQCHRSLRPPSSLRKWRWRSGSDFDNFATATILLWSLFEKTSLASHHKSTQKVHGLWFATPQKELGKRVGSRLREHSPLAHATYCHSVTYWLRIELQWATLKLAELSGGFQDNQQIFDNQKGWSVAICQSMAPLGSNLPFALLPGQ